MKAKVTKRLNQRIYSPNVQSDKLEPLEVNETIEIVEILNGQDIDGNNVWYKLDTGVYVWSGGVAGLSEVPGYREGNFTYQPEQGPFQEALDKYVNNNKLLKPIDYRQFTSGIPENVLRNGGKGAKVVVLDYAVSQTMNRISFESPLGNWPPKDGHGSSVATLIKGGKNIIGIAPHSKLISLPIHKRFEKSISMLNNALDYLENIKENVIVNFSYSIDESEIATREKIKSISEKDNILMFASAGSEHELLNAEIQFPASLESVIGVGDINNNYYVSHKSSINTNVDLITGSFEYYVHSMFDDLDFESFKNDSAACAMAAGMAALNIDLILSSGWNKSSAINSIKSNNVNQNLSYLNLVIP